MAMSEEEILREAGRIRAGRRSRVAKSCERCGTVFEGLTRAKYCSDACRMAAGRERHTRPAPDSKFAVYIEGRLAGESEREYVVRMRAILVAQGSMTEEEARITPKDEQRIALAEEMDRSRKELSEKYGPFDDSTELIRQMRKERSEHLMNL